MLFRSILSAICCLTLCCLPALAQKEHAAKGAAMTGQDFINMAAQTDMMEAHLGQMAERIRFIRNLLFGSDSLGLYRS